MIYQHPLAYLIGLEGRALLRAWAGDDDFDDQFVRDRLTAVRAFLDDDELARHPGVWIEPDRTEAAYAQWANHYDSDENGLFDLDEPLIEAIVAALPGRRRAVDVGCGTGRLTRRLGELGYEVTGIDGSAAMLERARVAVSGGDFRHGDLRALPLPDAHADLAVTGLALTHVAELTTAYAELARVLGPGGDLVVSDVHEDLVLLGSVVKGVGPDGRPLQAATTRHRTADHLSAALAAGFAVVDYQETPRPTSGAEQPLPAPERELGEWRDWPWTLLGFDPAATRAAWASPAVVVWHFRRS